MAVPKKGARNPKPQDEQTHPDKWERDLNPDRLEGQNIGGRRVDELSSRSAADLREFAETLSAFDRAELAHITIVPNGMRLKQGAVYLDLNDPSPRPITGTGEMSAGPENLYIPKAEIPYDYWNRLMAIFSPEGSDEPQTDRARKRETSEEIIDKTLADSFPTSDPPSWNMGKSGVPVNSRKKSKNSNDD